MTAKARSRFTSRAPAARPRAMPSPERVLDMMTAYQKSEALKTAIELDVFTGIDDGKTTPAALAVYCGASERGLRSLCDFLVVERILTKRAGRYGLSADAKAFLSYNSPACMSGMIRFLGSDLGKGQFARLTEAVKLGGTPDEKGTLEPQHPIWVEFARSMVPMMRGASAALAELLKVDRMRSCKTLDIAAGHGLFGVAVAKMNPRAQIVAVDWPNVLEIAQANAKAAGVASRHKLLAGSAFDVELGKGYDLVLLTNFLHHLDAAGCETLMRKVHACLAPGGRAVTLEFVPNEDRVSPPFPAAFSLVMLAATPAGDAYTFREYERIMRNAGFSRNELFALPPTPQSVIVSHRN